MMFVTYKLHKAAGDVSLSALRPRRQTNKPANKQTGGHHRCLKPPLKRRRLNNKTCRVLRPTV